MNADFYLSRRQRYLAEFNLMARLARPVLARCFKNTHIPELIADARRNFIDILPQLPNIGGKQPFTEFIVLTGMQLALYRTSCSHGKTIEDTAGLAFEIGNAVVSKAPRFLLRLFAPINFSSQYLQKVRLRAVESHSSQYPEDYVYNFIEGDGKTFDYGVDYIECASCKFLARQGAFELAQYLCPADILYSEAFGWGLTRTQTLAQGGNRCDFRFKQGGLTKVAVPPALDDLVSRMITQ